MSQESGAEKSLPASARKKERAREDGNVPKSQDMNAVVSLAAALLTLLIFGAYMMRSMILMGQFYFGNAHQLAGPETPFSVVMYQGIMVLGIIVGPFALAMVVAALIVNYLQVGVLFSVKAIQPKFSRINPLTGAKRFVSLRSLVELLKSLAKLAVVLTVIWLFLRSQMEELVTLMALSPWQLAPEVGWMVVGIWWRVVAAMLVIGVADLFFQRWQHERDLRMTVQEARQEAKELEGDPQIKRRVRQLQRQMAMQRMMQDVPTADVIITNPTHYAVALRYDAREMSAPTVVAKGMRLIADRIRETANEHKVPIVQRPELARTLYRTLDIGETVPESLFRAVAEVLSFVYQIDQRMEKVQERQAALG